MSWFRNPFKRNIIANFGPDGQPRNDRQKKQLEKIVGKLDGEIDHLKQLTKSSHLASIASFQRLADLQP